MRLHEAIPFWTLKELKQAATAYGPMVLCALGLIELLGQEIMAPNDWKPKAGLSPWDYLLWKQIYFELCIDQATCNAAHNTAITKDMLVGEGTFAATNTQLTFELHVYEQIKIAAMRVWRELPSKGETQVDLTSVYQGPHEPFQDFVA